MSVFPFVGLLLASYLIGAIPFGLIIVRLITGKDVRKIESGRTGGTNVMRAAGFWAGAITTILDVAKGTVVVWLVKWLMPGYVWLEVLAPVMSVLGHNYSIFLIERNGSGNPRLRGGAGGATTVGGAFGLWSISIFIIVPIGLLILFGIGYASIATMSVALIATILFAYRAWIGVSPWQYIFYGIFTEIILIWALRPNIQRLLNGTERVVGWRARRSNRIQKTDPVRATNHSSSSSSSSS